MNLDQADTIKGGFLQPDFHPLPKIIMGIKNRHIKRAREEKYSHIIFFSFRKLRQVIWNL